jgi:cytochrome P450
MDALRLIAVHYMQFYRDKVRESREVADNFVSEYAKRAGYDEEELAYILRDFITAGTETTASQLSWVLNLLGNHPDVMKRIQAEIDSVVPKGRLPSMEDKPNMPYTEAALLEVMRMKTVSPLGLPHATLRETEVGGFKIPANTRVICNLWSAHMNPDVWPEPDKFRPERFLDEMNNVTNRERMISFSMGKRVCLGEALARQELFLFMTALLQQFDILPPEGCDSIRAKDKMGVVRHASPFAVRFVSRA